RQRGLIELRGRGLACTKGDGVEAAEDRSQREEVGKNEHELSQLHRFAVDSSPHHNKLLSRRGPGMIGGANLLTLLAILTAGAILFCSWALFVRWLYRVRTPPPARLKARCADAWEIAVYHRPPARRRFAEPILLCHGLAANHFNFEFEPPYSLAHSLADAGFDCFTV